MTYRLKNLSLIEICILTRWENVGKKAPGSSSTRYNGLLWLRETVSVKLQRVLLQLLRLLWSFLARCSMNSVSHSQFCRLDKPTWQFNRPVIEYSMKISFDSSNDDNSDEDNDENQTSEEKLTSTEGTFNAIVRISLNFRFIFANHRQRCAK